MISNAGFAQNDIDSIEEALKYAEGCPGRFCMNASNYLSQKKGWQPYKYIIIEQIKMDEDYALNGLAAQSIWVWKEKFYSVVWFV
jgi:hypothetical protein